VSAFLAISISIISRYKSLRDRRLQKAAVCASPLSEKKEISYYRLKCDFSFGIWLTELNDSNEPIEMYHRDGY
jgi:hypothetical protein